MGGLAGHTYEVPDQYRQFTFAAGFVHTPQQVLVLGCDDSHGRQYATYQINLYQPAEGSVTFRIFAQVQSMPTNQLATEHVLSGQSSTAKVRRQLTLGKLGCTYDHYCTLS